MNINELIDKKNITKYRLSKVSGVPYSTISDICSGKVKIEKCSAETIYKIAKALTISMESLLEMYMDQRCDFELFKSNVCHQLKRLGDIDFLIETLKNDDISKYYKKKWYPECLYLLAMLDYISRVNDVPLCTKYNQIRKCKLKETIYPSSIIALSKVSKNPNVKEEARQNSIPEFINFNIVENEIRNVI